MTEPFYPREVARVEELRVALRVLLSDLEPLYLAAMCGEVAADERLTLVGTASSPGACADAAARLCPDLVALDAELDGAGGLEVLRRIRHEVPGARVCILGAGPGERAVLDAVRAGACGYLDKQMVDGAELRRQFVVAGEGGEAYDNRTLTVMMRALRAVEPTRRRVVVDLTPRQMEVLRHIAAGRSNAEIARHMLVSVNTVKTYVRGLFARLDVTDRAEAVGRAYDTGLLHGGGVHRAG